MSIIRVIVLVACVIVGAVSVGVPFYTAQGIQTNQGGDPLLTTKQLEDAPFVKPEITLPSALKLAEDGLRRKRDLTNYFLQEARLGYSRKNRIEPVW